MRVSAKPSPQANEDTRTFWEAARLGRLMMQKCAACGALRIYPQQACTECLTERSEWIQCLGHGRIYSFTTIYRAPLPAFADAVPYTLALIDLDEGPRMLSEVKGDPAAVHIGMRVNIVFDQDSDAMPLPKCELAE